MTRERLSYLLKQHLNRMATDAERAELLLAIENRFDESVWQSEIKDALNAFSTEQQMEQEHADLLFQRISAEKSISNASGSISFLKRSWLRYAAAIMLMTGLGTAAYLLTTNKRNAAASINTSPPVKVSPGGEKAILTLADGSKIILDNAVNGTLASQGGTQVIKAGNGQIAYDITSVTPKEVMWNTMTTPKGGQYRITLPDGTKVWLNAASSITFPTAFIDDKRRVKVTGEIYFEVAANKQKPFIVNIDEKVSVQVLGTSFNINSYPGERNINTTLVEGSVKVGSHDNAFVVLKAGEQARVPHAGLLENNLIPVEHVDVNQVVAWKNGVFDFNNVDLPAVMRQLERWYDIEVRYENNTPKYIFKGKMYRNVNFSDMLEVLEKMGIKYRLDGKILTVVS